jgi:hypothetical protein
MTWVRIDDGFADHPKLLAVGLAGVVLQLRALCYCSRNLTDGFVPDSALPILLHDIRQKEIVSRMISARLWERSEGGYALHDYLKYQQRRKDVLAGRRRAARRVAKWRASKRNAHVTPLHSDTYAVSNASPHPHPHPSSTTTTKARSTTPKPPSASPPGFADFWTAYPKRKAKADAEKAWRSLNPDDALRATILAAVAVQSKNPEWRKGDPPGQFVPLPATWLRGRRWQDEAGPTKQAWETPQERAAKGDFSGLASFFREDQK